MITVEDDGTYLLMIGGTGSPPTVQLQKAQYSYFCDDLKVVYLLMNVTCTIY